jgi:hypothetical protein
MLLNGVQRFVPIARFLHLKAAGCEGASQGLAKRGFIIDD